MNDTYFYKDKPITPEEMLKLIEKLEKEKELATNCKIRREILPEKVSEEYGWTSAAEPRVWTNISYVIRSVCFEPITYKAEKYHDDQRVITVQDFGIAEYMKYTEIFESLVAILNEHTILHTEPAQQEDADTDILDKEIEHLRLDVRSYNALKRRTNIKTVRDLTQQSEGDLKQIRCLGSGSIRRIKDILNIYGLHLKEN